MTGCISFHVAPFLNEKQMPCITYGTAGTFISMTTDEKKASSKAGLVAVCALNSNESASVFVILGYQSLGPLSSRPA
ncbi:hypothetical protein GCM10027343_25710 [Noviherbaspirillum agri]